MERDVEVQAGPVRSESRSRVRWVMVVALVLLVGGLTAYAAQPHRARARLAAAAVDETAAPVTDAAVETSVDTVLDTFDTVLDVVDSVSDTAILVGDTAAVDAGVPSTSRRSGGSGATLPNVNQDPRCVPILAAGAPMTMPNLVGMSHVDANLAFSGLRMWSYCTNSVIYLLTVPVSPTTVCTSDPAMADHVAAQSVAPGTVFSLPPVTNRVETTLFAYCPPTTPPTTAPPTPPAT
jgi:hypothetical protein